MACTYVHNHLQCASDWPRTFCSQAFIVLYISNFYASYSPYFTISLIACASYISSKSQLISCVCFVKQGTLFVYITKAVPI